MIPSSLIMTFIFTITTAIISKTENGREEEIVEVEDEMQEDGYISEKWFTSSM